MTKKLIKPVLKPKSKPKSKPKAKAKAKPKPKRKVKMGRPKFVIDYELVEKLGLIHCTLVEIGAFLECSIRTLERNEKFCRVYKKAIGQSKMSLRRHQWKLIEAGNCTMQIFVGKNILGQRDIVHDMDEQKVLKPVTIIVSSLDKPKVHFHNDQKDAIKSVDDNNGLDNE